MPQLANLSKGPFVNLCELEHLHNDQEPASQIFVRKNTLLSLLLFTSNPSRLTLCKMYKKWITRTKKKNVASVLQQWQITIKVSKVLLLISVLNLLKTSNEWFTTRSGLGAPAEAMNHLALLQWHKSKLHNFSLHVTLCKSDVLILIVSELKVGLYTKPLS